MWSWDKEKIKKKIDETLDFIIPIYHKYHNKKIIKELHLAVNVAIKQIVRKEKNKS
jgi:glutamate dehydrogenase/leucine dehydrogenase